VLCALAWMRTSITCQPRSPAAALATQRAQSALIAYLRSQALIQHQAGLVLLAACSLDWAHKRLQQHRRHTALTSCDKMAIIRLTCIALECSVRACLLFGLCLHHGLRCASLHLPPQPRRCTHSFAREALLRWRICALYTSVHLP